MVSSWHQTEVGESDEAEKKFKKKGEEIRTFREKC
jgi:hypothetical protein